MKITICNLIIGCFLILLSACNCYKTAENANLLYHNGFETKALVCCKSKSFFAYLKVRNPESQKFEKVYPDEIKRVSAASCNLIAMKFDKEKYGVNSFSFGKILSGEKLMLTDTKFKVNTCNCAGKDSWQNSHFLIYDDIILELETNRAGKIHNIKNVRDFVQKYTGAELSQKVSDVNSLSEFINNL